MNAPQFLTSVDLALYDRAALRYVEELGLTFPQVVHQNARLTNAELLRLTPPKTLAQGRAAVRRDISRAMWLLDASKVHNEILATAIRDGEFDVVQAFVANLRRRGAGGSLGGHRLEHFSPSLHQSRRDRRGRVRRPTGVMVIEKRDFERYVREIQGHVGSTKFGWAISGVRLGVQAPSWVLGHSQNQGEFSQDDNPQNPSVTMTNKAPGIDSLGAGFVQGVVDRRTRAMTRDVDQILSGRASKYFN